MWGLRQYQTLLGGAEMPIFLGGHGQWKKIDLPERIFQKMLGSPIRRIWKPKGVYPGETPGTVPGPKCPGMRVVMHVHLLFLFFCKKLSGAL